MSYEGEFASYRPLQRIAEAERVKLLLSQAKHLKMDSATILVAAPEHVPETDNPLPEWVLAIDGSNAEVDVVNGYPGAKIGYCTVASVLLNLKLIGELDAHRPVDPVRFREIESLSTVDAALPGSNIIIRADDVSARDSFRWALFREFKNQIPDDEDQRSILETYEDLLALKPAARLPSCPYDYDGCERNFLIQPGMSSCPCDKQRAIYSTDALRIHERFHDTGPNGEALGEVMQVWERVFLIHIMKSFEQRGWARTLRRLAFVMDGPLAFFGHPAWMSTAVGRELKRLNAKVHQATGEDILLLGIEKSGTFVDHFAQIDQTEEPGKLLFEPGTCFLPSDEYIKQRIIYSTSEKQYGADTYFGRKLFYKTASGARIVVNVPFLTDEQDSLESSDVGLYPQVPRICALLDKLVSSRYENAVTPIVSAHAAAAIPLHLGTKVLEQLAHALMKDS
jgi:hypothetical protein